MAAAETEEAWGRVAKVVYATSLDEADKAYTHWADKYDEDITSTLDNVSCNELAKNSMPHIKNEESSQLLDLAAGTGLVGVNLRKCGYIGMMDALELNAAMLKKAEEKEIYRKHICFKMSTSDPLPVPDGSYDTATISGALGPNHLEPECIAPVIQCLKPGGLLIFNSRSTDQNKNYREHLEKFLNEMVKCGKIELTEEKEVLHYRQKCKETGDVMRAHLFIYKKL